MRYAEATFASLFSSWGYHEIRVPLVERASSFSEEVIGGSPWPEWDRRGVFYVQLAAYADSYTDLPHQEPALLVPEGTVSVSRWLAGEYAAGRFAAPTKLFYLMPCFRNKLTSKLSTTKGRQFHQAGIEILGSGDVRADLEVLLIAHEGFRRVGIPQDEILVRIGSVGLFNAVCAETGLDASEILTVKDLMDTIAEARASKQPDRLAPSIAAVMKIVAGKEPPSDTQRKWELLTDTYTPVLGDQFRAAVGYEAETDALNFLASSARGLGITCVIDPSVVRSHEYYTGMVYELDIRPKGRPPLVEVAGGGRYNKLTGKFLDGSHGDLTIPAVGFAYGLERVVRIVQEATGERDTRRQVALSFPLGAAAIDAVVADGSGERGSALTTAARLRGQGLAVDYYVGDDQSPAGANAYADRLGASLHLG
ncbi:MAG: hypothetical protein HKP61_16440 [Dactylosporangium sp.]|nr:ATP phosphoribosyltransferase regulatory subunit [Dactylosporangium sp.]NNJ62496.1 hypothetical protein [Dactylosporangium sp.]